MYTDFYHLNEKPFNLTPSPRYLYLGDGHKEALALLTYGVMERKGFILLTGEVGTGKTTMVRALLESLDTSVKYVHISNPLLSMRDFIGYLSFSAFKKKMYFKSKAAFLLTFEAFLRRCLKKRTNFNLIVDEAHKLSYELLEEIRLLSNMETAEEKLINIILVGQPELNETLNQARCRPLLQRISIRYHIPPLNYYDTLNYIKKRLHVAGAPGNVSIFSKRALKDIYRYTAGFPREINVLADNAMLLGYSKGLRNITSAMVKSCYKDMQLDTTFNKMKARQSEYSKSVLNYRNIFKFQLRWVVIIFLIGFLIVFFSTRQRKGILSELSNFVSQSYYIFFDETNERKISLEKNNYNENHGNIQKNENEILLLTHQIEEAEREKATNVSIPSIENIVNDRKSTPSTEKQNIIIVKKGDSLSKLVSIVYGRMDEAIIHLVHNHNPHIVDIDKIEIGQEIFFPRIQGDSIEGIQKINKVNSRIREE